MTWFIPFETEKFYFAEEDSDDYEEAYLSFVEYMRLATGDNQHPLIKKIPFRKLLRGYTLKQNGDRFRVIAKRTNRKAWSGRIFVRFFSKGKIRCWYRPSAVSILTVTMLWCVLAILALYIYFDYQTQQHWNKIAIVVLIVGLIFQLFQLNRIFKQIQKMKTAVRQVFQHAQTVGKPA